MREDFLHFLWRTRRFNANALFTTDGLPVQIFHPGEYNTHSGPDFFNARLRLGDTEWAGNVEMHLRASEWLAHQHDTDAAYDSVVLHVVWENDVPIFRKNGEKIPCLILKGRVAPGIVEKYDRLLHEAAWIPCEQAILQVPPVVQLNWNDRLLVERLEQKTQQLEQHLATTAQHWEEAFYRAVAWSFGLKINPEPFEALARSLPIHLLSRHRNDLFQTEALLFGQSGLLQDELKDDYPKELLREHRFLQHKYGLQPLLASQWKFLRLRPVSFPTVRIAQFAALMHQSEHLFAALVEAPTVRAAGHLFAVNASAYWDTHYRFDVESRKQVKTPGPDFIQLIMINTVIPALFYYGKTRHIPAMKNKALQWLEELPAEKNTVIEGWQEIGIKARNAFDSQALLQLKKQYCDKRQCVHCAVGGYLLRE